MQLTHAAAIYALRVIDELFRLPGEQRVFWRTSTSCSCVVNPLN